MAAHNTPGFTLNTKIGIKRKKAVSPKPYGTAPNH